MSDPSRCLVSPAQASFIPGRQIIDNVVIVQEVLHSMAANSRCKSWMIMKIDLEKAYDRVCGDFLKVILAQAAIPEHLVDVIMKCQMSREVEML